MSYNGTVRCSYCYEKGHNKLGCPERRKKALAEPDSFIGRQWHREQERRKESIERRTCSYCKAPGHNRRGCPSLKEDKKLILARQEEFLKSFSQATSSVGLGPGTLVRVPTGRTYDDGGPFARGFVAMVQGFDWNNIDFLMSDTNLRKGWRVQDTQVARLRVISSFGYPEDDYWQRKPNFNDIQKLSYINIHKMIPGIFSSTEDFGEESQMAAQLLSPSKLKVLAPSATITEKISKEFHLQPGPRADEWDKARVDILSDKWSKVRKDEHLKALKAEEEKRRGE